METLLQDLYPAIFTRKSVRSYTGEPLTEDQLADLASFFSRTVPLLPEQPLEVVVRPDRGAPHRALAYCENTIAGNANLGFRLQQMDLYLHTRGIGSLWYGMGRRPRDVPEMNPLSYAICMRFGHPGGPLGRDASGFKRNPVETIVDDPECYPILEAARLAPSATNAQPWYFVAGENVIHAYREDIGFLRDKVYGRMRQVDMGIVLCHLVLSLQHAGYTVNAELLETAPPREKYVYTISIRYTK